MNMPDESGTGLKSYGSIEGASMHYITKHQLDENSIWDSKLKFELSKSNSSFTSQDKFLDT